MPRQVDATARRREIAASALAIASETGLGSVTFRRVADRLGSAATTSTVTHYVPTRSELMQLTFHYAFDKIEAIGTPMLRIVPARVALALIIEGTLPLKADTRLLARLWIEIVMEADRAPELQAMIASHMAWYREEINRALLRLDLEGDVAAKADLIIAGLDGITIGALAEPDRWPAVRQRRAAYRLLAVLGVPALRKPGKDKVTG